jgi:Ca-activated chloride channel family protein
MSDITAQPQRRPNFILLAIGAVAAVLLAGSLLYFATRPAAPLRARSIGARLDLAAGDVTVTEGGTSEKELSGTPLAHGSHITTGKGSRALVRTADGAAVFLRGETEIVLADKGIELAKGEVWLDAPRLEGNAIECRLGKHLVSASDAGLSIRRSGDDAAVYVARGLSILTSPGGRIEINAGEEGTAQGGGAPKIAPVAFWQDWTGGMGDQHGAHGAIGSGSGRLYGLDPNAPPGVPAQKLGIAKQVVKAVVRDGIAETEVDQTFSNPGAIPIEGWYWFTVPPTATISSFAVETNGVLVEGEVVEKREAAARYAVAVRQAYDPALLEWVDGRTYRARIYPLPASGTRRVVLRYVELLPSVEGKMRYVYPLRSDDPVRFDEFSLSVDVGATASDIQTATSLDAITEGNGKLVTMRRSGYLPRADFQLEMTAKKKPKPMRAWRFNAGADQADYVMLRYVPEVDFTALPPSRGELVLVVDTSAGGDENARQLRISAAEAILRALSDEDRFAVVTVDVSPTVVYPKEGLAKATDTDIAEALEKLNDHGMGGASDLGAMFEPALERLHNAEQPAIVYVGDGAPTSGETTADGLTERLRRSLSGSRARFFAVGVGSDTHHELLGQLTLSGGGQYLRIDEPEQTTGQALRLASAIKTPTITDLEVDLGAGLDQPFYSSTGKLSRGEEMVLLARTHHALPANVSVKGRVGQKDQTWSYPIIVENSVTTALVPRLWASEYMRRLLGSGSSPDENRAKVLSLGVEYGLMTPYTSILALDSDGAYAREGIQRRNTRLRGVRLTSLETQKDEDDVVRRLAPPLPRTMAGCDNKSEATPPSNAAGNLEEKSGGTGARAKGEEGTMGSPSPAMAPPLATTTAQSAPVDVSAAAPDEPGQPGHGRVGGLNGIGAGNAGGAAMPQGAAKAAQSPPPPPSMPHRNGPAGLDAKESIALAAKIAETRQDKTDALQRGDDRERAEKDSGALKKATRPLARCSDSASRPLAERMVLWQKRLKQVTMAVEVAAQYDMALAYCELPDWRDQAAFLDLVQQRVDNEGAAQIILAHFAGEEDAQKFLARRILRRTVDIRVAAAVSRVIFGEIDWLKVDRQLFDIEKPQARLIKLRTAMLAAPGDPAGDVRLVKLLALTGEKAEAISYGRRLRDRGLLTPSLAQQLGDVLADAGENDEALRTYSEVVEFDGNNPASRRVLGDIYFRRGWFTAAYRQYKTLTDLDPRNPLGWLRLAGSAAGAGRIDEALRIEREVATGEGSPGPNDPRYFARLWSAARLGILLGNPAPNAPAGSAEAIHRKLKELQLFSGPGTLAMVVWNDLDARIALAAADEKKESLAGETTDAGVTGLYSLLASNDTWEKTARAVRWKADAPGRSVKYKVVALTWDGKKFWVKIKDGDLKPEVLKEAI